METYESAYQAAARAIMRKVDEKAIEADGTAPPPARVKQVAAAAKALKALTPAQIKELKRDPKDLVLTGHGSAAQELKRDPGDLLLGKGRKKGRGKLEPAAVTPAEGAGNKPAFGSPAWRAKYMKKG